MWNDDMDALLTVSYQFNKFYKMSDNSEINGEAVEFFTVADL